MNPGLKLRCSPRRRILSRAAKPAHAAAHGDRDASHCGDRAACSPTATRQATPGAEPLVETAPHPPSRRPNVNHAPSPTRAATVERTPRRAASPAASATGQSTGRPMRPLVWPTAVSRSSLVALQPSRQCRLASRMGTPGSPTRRPACATRHERRFDRPLDRSWRFAALASSAGRRQDRQDSQG
jgi:hypothetical protein